MELSQALESIKRLANKFAYEEVECIRENREEAIPFLLEQVRNAADHPELFPENIEDFDDPIYSMFLLAEFRVHDAFESFIKIAEFSEEDAEWVMGDVLTDDLGPLIASVAHINDLDRIKVVIENSGINEYQRLAALTSLVTMYAEGVYPREDLFEYLGHLLDNFEDDDEFITFIVHTCHEVSAIEHYEHIKKLYADDKVDTMFIGINYFDGTKPFRTVEKALAELRDDHNTTFITDTVKSVSNWACFRQEPVSFKNVGRNDPCPCGSGKKYKKCCIDKH